MATASSPHNATTNGVVQPSQVAQFELAHPSQREQDREHLARLGKKQVLKVRFNSSGINAKADSRTAQIWLHIHAGFQFYSHGHLGRCSCVCFGSVVRFKSSLICDQGYSSKVSASVSMLCTRVSSITLLMSCSGGPAGLIYGFLFIWAGTICVFLSLGELASMYSYVDQ